MRTISACIFIFLSISGICQETYYDYVPLGSYHVGFCDNIIYNQEIQYKQYGYEGNQPVFLQIWFPTAIDSDQDLMKFDDFRDRQVPEALESVYQELLKHMDESFIRDGITYHLETDNPIDYGTKSYSDILELVKSQQTKSLRSALPVDADYPVIVYHHGSQGMSDENSIMAEYFASRGYIFISANFHMPYPNTPFGLLPYELEKENKHDQSTAKKVLQYAKSITSSNRPSDLIAAKSVNIARRH
ncbi:alpha/beta hydrolase family protein [Flagellimonas okinawensis]|uniref:Alpha/beta hydrolase n=1 Tax=Flagellimonas okinawensis TaxID=3031324 RepID=A0ABT5XJ50_9FLAO|nr:hypothetical protein [[Muricauda] okinawensis]MDF0705701.1 hypothetical protein [[Muricauda] okinawensis]